MISLFKSKVDTDPEPINPLFNKPNFEELDTKITTEICSKATTINIPELDERVRSFRLTPTQKIKDGETVAEKTQRFKTLHKNGDILRNTLNHLRELQERKEILDDAELRSTLVDNNLSDFRVSIEENVESLRLGLIPVEAVKFKKINSSVIEVHCHSGVNRKFDIKKIKTVFLKEMIENHNNPFFFTVENEGWLNLETKKMSECWQHDTDPTFDKTHREVNYKTTLAIMVV